MRDAVLTIELSQGKKVLRWSPFRQDSQLRPRLCSEETLAEGLQRLEALSTALLDLEDVRQALADRVIADTFKERRAALQWTEEVGLARPPKWRYVTLGIFWLAARLRKAKLRKS